ncbi:hypothetical protein RhiirA5_429186 [Rhizophagus irregularis]|uniref:Uncharacterized protein n=1 Tax=Rhizophagus irregularis TaxID=588596 RepID=A0A2N0NYY9_9GLOM|nr:hypothetical protein RhiirA5_429186 [Rhizophagus irregularis]
MDLVLTNGRNFVAINPDYVTDSTSDFPPISYGENSDNKKNYKANETQKKKRKSTGIEGISREKKLIQQYELEKSKLEIERLRAENEKVKLELKMLKFRKNNK